MLPLTVGLIVVLVVLIVFSISACLPSSNAVPVLGFGAFSALLCVFPATVYSIAWTAYLLHAQQDRPPYSLVGSPALARMVPYLPLAPLRCFKVAKATMSYLVSCLYYLPLAKEWLVTYVLYTRVRNQEDPIYDAIPYAIPFKHQVLDVYPPPRKIREGTHAHNPDLTNFGTYRGAPVVILVPAPIVPVRILSHRKTYLLIATKLRAMGYCVVVPDIQYYPHVRIRQSIGDLRLALSWVGAHISSYGGNPANIYAMGFGLSAHLITISLVQETTALSEAIAHHTAATMGLEGAEPTNGRLRQKGLEIYLPQVRLPQLAGVVLVAGLSDVIKGYRHETEQGIEHLSYLRRWTGPSHAQCLLHSPAHLLMESKHVLDASFLPAKFLLIHGGMDTTIPLYHSALLRTLLNDAGVEDVKMRAYRNLKHFEALACLADRYSPYARQVLTDVREFIS